MPNIIATLFFCIFISGCDSAAWNNPYSAEEVKQNVYYDSFSERPKHLDPVSSYSANEYVFLGQIYEPPLQYHFLKRPYELIPLTATSVPDPIYYDEQGLLIERSAREEDIAKVVYRINLKKYFISAASCLREGCEQSICLS